MPLYLCRWPNGDCSLVWARNKAEALIALDQVGNAEGCPFIPLKEFQLHLRLSDEGQLESEAFGEGMKETILHVAYPLLEQTLAEVYAEGEGTEETITPAQQERIRAAVQRERERVQVDRSAIVEPETEIGKDSKRQTGMATPLINRIVQQTSKRMLADSKGGGNLH
jgi:hypothetical protein